VNIDAADLGDALCATLNLPGDCDHAALVAAVRALSPDAALAALQCAVGLLAEPATPDPSEGIAQ